MQQPPLLKMPGRKTGAIVFRASPEIKRMLKDLAQMNGTTSSAVFESLVIEKAVQYGLIERQAIK